MLKLYGIYYIFYPFEDDDSQGKFRPVIILDPKDLSKGFYITSSNKYDDEDYSYPIQKYQGTGLVKKSWILFDRYVRNLDISECKLVGYLDPFDIKYASNMMQSYLNLNESLGKSRINSYAQKFIEKHIKLIDKDDFKTLYEESLQWEDFYEGNFTPILTKTLLEANINPLDCLDYIPSHYMYEEDITEFEIPEHIERIEDSAFEYCDKLTRITIPYNVDEIGNFVFSSCYNIVKLKIDNPFLKCGVGAFEKFYSIIEFGGTYEEWEQFKEINALTDYIETNRLICVDKVVAK